MIKDYLDQIIKYATSQRYENEVITAKKEYLAVAGELFEDDKSYENRMAAFLEWYTFDRFLSNQTVTPAELFMEENRSSIPSDQISIFEGFLNSIHGIFVLKKIRNDHVVIYNEFDDRKYSVVEQDGEIFFHKNDIFEGRLIPVADKYYFTGIFTYHPQDAYKFIKSESKAIIQESKQSEKILKKMNSDLATIESKIKKVNEEIAKIKLKIENSGADSSNSPLALKLSECLEKALQYQIQDNALKKQISEWKLRVLKISGRQTKERLIQRLSYMNLKWERSRNIALRDIYKNNA